MKDTIEGTFTDEECADCDETQSDHKHWGELVPPGETRFFCTRCIRIRSAAYRRGEASKPLGYLKVKNK